MSLDQIDFASLLCSRLCHDLLSPVGALNNGLELMADEKDPEMRARCFELLEQSARTSAGKLKFFRLAFGSAGGFGDEIAADEIRAAIEGIVNDRTTLGWLVSDTSFPKPAAKILLNLTLVAVDAMVRGGQLDIGAERRDDVIEIVVRGAGARITIDPEIRLALEGDMNERNVSSRTAAAWMTQGMARSAGGAIMVESGNDEEGNNLLVLGSSLRLDR